MFTHTDHKSDRLAFGRRTALQGFLGATALILPVAASLAGPASAATLEADKPAGSLEVLTRALAAAPRRRSFPSVPFMVTTDDGWDGEAAGKILAYPMRRQMWEFTDVGGSTLGLMREALNSQRFAFKNPDFLAVATTHGAAHLALFGQTMWDKHNLAALTDGKFQTNTLIVEKAGVKPSDSIQDLQGFYGPNNNNVISLQRRGAVFIACHDSIHAIARTIAAKRPDGDSPDIVAADLTNNLIAGAVLVPSVVGFMEELQRRGFTYAKG